MSNDHVTEPELLAPCKTADELHAWLRKFLDIDVPRVPVCAGHQAPFEYLYRAYREPASDIIIWAPRGGGKTRLAAAATLLDLLHKPGCGVRILGGSLDQSLRLWEHLLPDLEKLVPEMISRSRGGRKIELNNGSTAAVLAQSQRAVRGLRVQKLRCDEVNLFKPDIWEAAQLVTRSRDDASGAIEALSTLHTPFGLMSRLVEQARTSQIPVVRWCLMEVLERCPIKRDCTTCPLWEDCGGVAKEKCNGFVRIDDAIAMKRRVSRETWDCEMLCRKPSIRGCVFPSFDEERHVREHSPPASERFLAIDFGFSAPFVCLWIEACADGSSYVIDEYVQPGRTIDEHIQQLRLRPWNDARRIFCDPAGAGRSDQTAASNVQLLRAAGFIVKHKRSFIVDGIEMIRAALRPASGQPALFIHPRCTRLIRAMRSFRYADGGSELPLKDGEHDHLIDALRYYFVNRQGAGASTRRY